jgi:quercetin dioxygenase-like cupin family protein
MPEPITRTIMEKFDVPDSGYETVMMLVEMAPHVNSGLHTHPGFDSAYLLEAVLRSWSGASRTSKSARVNPGTLSLAPCTK